MISFAKYAGKNIAQWNSPRESLKICVDFPNESPKLQSGNKQSSTPCKRLGPGKEQRKGAEAEDVNIHCKLDNKIQILFHESRFMSWNGYMISTQKRVTWTQPSGAALMIREQLSEYPCKRP
eukprot:TRINITY_DN6038_c0_g2_i1.p2 TRINITY_DN6038_c0_g2~~TRINITY_DN6038_c0_g2_i1.p2  ORF type:complete len:122 (-),score=1.12 TRINITY_DN6038_c0_g2_i1:103-468(-)